MFSSVASCQVAPSWRECFRVTSATNGTDSRGQNASHFIVSDFLCRLLILFLALRALSIWLCQVKRISVMRMVMIISCIIWFTWVVYPALFTLKRHCNFLSMKGFKNEMNEQSTSLCILSTVKSCGLSTVLASWELWYLKVRRGELVKAVEDAFCHL